MKQSSRWSPVIRDYSASLLSFIRFIRDHYPIPTGEGTFGADREDKPGSEEE